MRRRATLDGFHGFPRGHETRNLDPERVTERPAGIVRLRTVVSHEDAVVAAITIEHTAEFSDISRCCNPARRLRIELAQLLQFEILFFRQKLNAHGCGHIYDAVFGVSLD